MKVTRKIIEIDDELCTGCGDCVPDCAEGSLEIVDGKARLVEDRLCDGLGACLKACPTGALSIIEREAEEFDEEAVEAFLAEKEKQEPSRASGCPSANLQSLQPAPCATANIPGEQAGSTLSHWPIQIRLVPAAAGFLEGADLLVAADCTAISYPDINRGFVKDRIVMMGCPKFDDAEFYVQRFTEIFQQRDINSVTVMIMEVPCCSAMLQIIKKARDDAGSPVPVRQVVVSTRGEIIHDRKW